MHLLKSQEVFVQNYRPHTKERMEKKATGKFHHLCKAGLLHNFVPVKSSSTWRFCIKKDAKKMSSHVSF